VGLDALAMHFKYSTLIKQTFFTKCHNHLVVILKNTRACIIKRFTAVISFMIQAPGVNFKNKFWSLPE
jgi:hypothetical protein